jgi:16S rRNA (guanine527-N7)-methyltransferase
MATLAEYLLPLVRVVGWAAAQKSGDAQVEVESAGAAIEALGGHLGRIAPVEVPGVNEPRSIVMIEKVAPTPAKYPRRAGMPEKRPIRG